MYVRSATITYRLIFSKEDHELAKIPNDSKLNRSQDPVIAVTQYLAWWQNVVAARDQEVSDRVIPRSWVHLNHEEKLQVEQEIRELTKNEAESTDASEKLVLVVFLRKHPRFSSDNWDWLE